MPPYLFTVSYYLFCELPFLFNPLDGDASAFQSQKLLRKVCLWQVASIYFRKALWSNIKVYRWTHYWEASSVATCAGPMLQQRMVSLFTCMRSIQFLEGSTKQYFVENWLLRRLSWQVGFMKNGRVKSLQVSYYSNGGNSVDLSYGVSKIFWWLTRWKMFPPFALTWESCRLQHCLHILHSDMTKTRPWWVFGAALWANSPALACAT